MSNSYDKWYKTKTSIFWSVIRNALKQNVFKVSSSLNEVLKT